MSGAAAFHVMLTQGARHQQWLQATANSTLEQSKSQVDDVTFGTFNIRIDTTDIDIAVKALQ